MILHWHAWLGLLTLPVLIGAVAARWLDRLPSELPLASWLPRFRRAVEVMLYMLLVLQPFSGWLLASHEGRLPSFFGLTLPPLALPNSAFAYYGYVYHGLGGVLIPLIAVVLLRLNATALVFSSVVRRFRGRGAGSGLS